jgi:hypothetical protein
VDDRNTIPAGHQRGSDHELWVGVCPASLGNATVRQHPSSGHLANVLMCVSPPHETTPPISSEQFPGCVYDSVIATSDVEWQAQTRSAHSCQLCNRRYGEDSLCHRAGADHRVRLRYGDSRLLHHGGDSGQRASCTACTHFDLVRTARPHVVRAVSPRRQLWYSSFRGSGMACPDRERGSRSAQFPCFGAVRE